jgi:hypothetical protein
MVTSEAVWTIPCRDPMISHLHPFGCAILGINKVRAVNEDSAASRKRRTTLNRVLAV